MYILVGNQGVVASATMAIRCLSSPFSPPSAPLRHKILVSKAPTLILACRHRSIAVEDKNHRFRSVGKAMVSAEKDLVANEVAKDADDTDYGVVSIHHVGFLCENLEKSLAFYKDLLGLEINEARPHEKLPYRGAWLWVGSEMIHLMELPNPDPLTGRPEHGGRDRHACIAIRDVSKLKAIFDKAGISYTLSRSGRPAIFTRDPDGNALEFTQVD